MESSDERSSIGLGELPQNCISLILSFTTPFDAGRLALVSNSWRSAADSDALWVKMLPSHYPQILERAKTPVPYFPSMKQLYLHLCQSILIDNGTKRVWVDRSTGKVGCMVSTHDSCFIWEDENTYHPALVSCETSLFEEVAILSMACWFAVKGRFECTLLSPNTRYRVYFVLKIRLKMIRYYEENGVPFRFLLDSVGGDHTQSVGDLYELESIEDMMTLPPCDSNGWMEFAAGEFFLEEDGGIPREIEFSMEYRPRSLAPTRMLIDGVRIQPVC